MVTVPLPFISASCEKIPLVKADLQNSKQVRRLGLARQPREVPGVGEDWGVVVMDGVGRPLLLNVLLHWGAVDPPL